MAFSTLAAGETVPDSGVGWRIVLAVSTIDPDTQGGWRSWRHEYEVDPP